MQWAQVVTNALSAACVYALLGLGFGLIYSTARFFHFAHGAVYTFAPYFVFLMAAREEPSRLIWAVPAAIGCSVLLGCLIELTVYRSLRRRNASGLVLLLGSLGIFIVLQNAIAIVFGDDTKTLSFPGNSSFAVLGAQVTTVQLMIIVAGAAMLSATHLFLRRTRFGWSIRAVGSDPALARAVGIDASRVVLATIALGSALGGIAGILVAMDSALTPTMGMNALMMGVVVVIVGGVGSFSGVASASLLLAFLETAASFAFGSLWKQATAFAVLAVFLVVRPQGFFGTLRTPDEADGTV